MALTLEQQNRRHLACRIAAAARVATAASIPGGLLAMTAAARAGLAKTYERPTDALLTPAAAQVAQAARRRARMLQLAAMSADFRRNRKLARSRTRRPTAATTA